MLENSKIKYWVELSDYDLETAKVMLDGGRYLYVGFMCHQSIEKILKAVFVHSKNETPPYTHNLSKLAELSGIINDFSEDQKNLLFFIQPLNIEARYPSYKAEVSKSLNKENSLQLYSKIKELQLWVKQKL